LESEIVMQKIIFFVVLCTGYFWIISSPINYYGIASTILLLLTFVGGGIANHRFRNSQKNSENSPTLSVVIPVKDEEKNIYETIKKYAQVNYPKNRFEVIVVNDGSKDRTWLEMQRARKDFGASIKIKLFSFKTNKGKRKALAFAIRHSSGEIIVTTDSDTFVDKNALCNLVKPFIDKSVAGVTGHTYVRNRDQNLLTMMQAGIYFYAYRMVRMFESLFGCVLCLPGTLSAFRKEYVLKVLDEWERARPFLGEDRHLTYLLLRDGYKTLYVNDAKCETIVPQSLKRYLQQQVRWAKGYLIETFRGCGYMFNKHPIIVFIYYMQYILTLYLPFAIVRIFILFATVSPYWWGYFAFVGSAFLVKAVWSYRYNKHISSWAVFLFLFINLILNAWRIPLALLTLSEKTRWSR